MDELCAAYSDPASKVNACRNIQRDSRCMIDDMPLHQSLEIALWSPSTCPRGKEMRMKVCECSCWSQIVDVYTPMFQQWGMYDASVNEKLTLLQTMCASNVVGTLLVNTVEESSTAQCGINNITIRMRASLSLPAGTEITITGLNAQMAEDSPVVSSTPQGLIAQGGRFKQAHCTQWCTQVGLCPSTGSAVSDGCLAMPTEASGMVTGGRCAQWCDEDAIVVLTVAREAPANTDFSFSFRMLNPSMNQQPAIVTVTASAAGLYIPTTVSSARPIGKPGVLSASSSPQFDPLTFTVTELPCPGTFDTASQKWKGSCAGMLNTLTISMKPNVRLLPGARVTLSGLTRCEQACDMDVLWPAPVVNATTLQVDTWNSPSGILVLRVSASPLNEDEVMTFSLDVQMPQFPDPPADKAPVKISASRGGPELSCNFLETSSASPVLVAKRPSMFSFTRRTVKQQKCSPGMCNEITVELSVNQALDQSQGDVVININGFRGMERDAKCAQVSECNDDGESIPLFDQATGMQAIPLSMYLDVHVACVERAFATDTWTDSSVFVACLSILSNDICAFGQVTHVRRRLLCNDCFGVVGCAKSKTKKKPWCYLRRNQEVHCTLSFIVLLYSGFKYLLLFLHN